MRPSYNKPFAVSHFIKRFFEKTKVLLNQTSVNQKLKLAVLDASSTLGSICKHIHSISRIGVGHRDVRCDWVVVGSNGMIWIQVVRLPLVSDPQDALAPVWICVEFTIVLKIRRIASDNLFTNPIPYSLKLVVNIIHRFIFGNRAIMLTQWEQDQQPNRIRCNLVLCKVLWLDRYNHLQSDGSPLLNLLYQQKSSRLTILVMKRK